MFARTAHRTYTSASLQGDPVIEIQRGLALLRNHTDSAPQSVKMNRRAYDKLKASFAALSMTVISATEIHPRSVAGLNIIVDDTLPDGQFKYD